MANNNLTFNASASGNQPIATMQALIERRMKLMNMTVEQATTAMAIQVMKSLRADTRKAKLKPNIVSEFSGNMQIKLTECKNLFVSFKKTGGRRIPCIRIGSKEGARSNIKPWWRVGHTKELYKAKVFKTELSEDRAKVWKRLKKVAYIVAKNESHAKRIARDKFKRLIKYSSGLAKSAWSRAMQLTSGRNQRLQTTNSSPLEGNILVKKDTKGFSSGKYSITVTNNLSYAEESMNKGKMSVTTAMMKASNVTNAIINRFIDEHRLDFFDKNSPLEKMKTPFTEDMMK